DFHYGLIGYQQLRKKPQTQKLPKASNEKFSNEMSRFPTYDSSSAGSEGGLSQDHSISPSVFSGGRQTNSIANNQLGTGPGQFIASALIENRAYHFHHYMFNAVL
ncbi:hypothetical protein MKX01_041231, partial [Papaver californicum]